MSWFIKQSTYIIYKMDILILIPEQDTSLFSNAARERL